jgi:spore cortex biosynthesis protein YabQ
MWVERQFPYFCWMILSGVFIMLGYDALRIFRRLVKHSDFVVNIEDLLYTCVCAVFVFGVTYMKNSGEFRIQTFLGLITGGILYYFIIGTGVVKGGTWLFLMVGRILKRIVKVILYPLYLVIKILLKPARVIVWYTGKGFVSLKHKSELKMKNLKHIIRRK